MSETDIKHERLKKIDLLKARGMQAYPIESHISTTAQEFQRNFESLEKEKQSITIGGRVMSLRGQGSILFSDLFDGTGKTQAIIQKGFLTDENFTLFQETVDAGDFIEVTGIAITSKRGAKSLQVQAWRMLSKSLLGIPDSWYGLKDEELKLRERYLAILLDPELRALFERRTAFWQIVRTYYLEHGFLEVETPILEPTPGGAEARTFDTHHNALDIDVSLRIALELHLKRMLVAGFPKVFEIGRVFRNEGQSREHLQDYTMCESYEAFKDMRYGMTFIQNLYRRIAHDVYGKYTFSINGHEVDLASEWVEIDLGTILKARYGINLVTCSEDEAIQAVRDAQIPVGEKLNLPRAIDHLWKAIRKETTGPAFLTGVPAYMEPLAKRTNSSSQLVERFQVIFAGSEVGKGFSELNDPEDQRSRFEEQQKLRDAGDDEAQRLDEDFVRALEYGMPPAFGFGMSERIFSFLENRPAHEAQLFPLLRPRVK